MKFGFRNAILHTKLGIIPANPGIMPGLCKFFSSYPSISAWKNPVETMRKKREILSWKKK